MNNNKIIYYEKNNRRIFMDFSDAEHIEIQYYQLRDNWLRTLFATPVTKLQIQ